MAVCAPALPLVPTLPSTVRFVGFELVPESPLTVSVLVCPDLIEAGLNEQVAPDSQDRLMALVKLLGADIETVKVVDAVPTRIVFEVAVEESE